MGKMGAQIQELIIPKIVRPKSKATQAKLRNTVEIINRVTEWSGNIVLLPDFGHNRYILLVIKQLKI